MKIKDVVRRILLFLRFDLTKNLEYDRLTKLILKEKIKSNHNCIDIGAHKGKILDLMIAYAPYGHHYAFEPIPYFYQELNAKHFRNVRIYPYALSDNSGKTTFNYVKNAPAYSGLKKRKYAIAEPDIEEIEVEVKTLDELIPPDKVINFIKIDVEGGEFGVLKGAKKVLLSSHPIVLFGCSKEASEYYGTKPDELYQFLTHEVKFKVFTLKSFLNKQTSLTEDDFVNYFNTNKEYYFVASYK